MTKKTLIELMLENNVQWPEGAEFAAQDKSGLNVAFCRGGKPKRDVDDDYWHAPLGCSWTGHTTKIPELCRNWHQTIVTREQYEAAIAARGATIISTHSASEVVSKISDCEHHDGDVYSVDISDSDDETVIVEYLDVDSIINKIAHHQAESQRHEEAMLDHNDKELALRDQLNEMLSKVGMKVVDVEREVGTIIKTTGEELYTAQPEYEVSKPSLWPDYCDENGIITDWDKVPEGSEVSCVYNADWDFFDVGSIYKVGMDTYRDYGPIDSDGDAPCLEKLSEMEFRLIK